MLIVWECKLHLMLCACLEEPCLTPFRSRMRRRGKKGKTLCFFPNTAYLLISYFLGIGRGGTISRGGNRFVLHTVIYTVRYYLLYCRIILASKPSEKTATKEKENK